MSTQTADEAAQAFFHQVFVSALEVIAALPLTIEPPPMAYVTGVLEPAIEAARSRSPFGEMPEEPALERRAAFAVATEEQRRTIGLNTIGMLLDRLSILAIKHWNLENRAKNAATAATLVTTQVEELVSCLARALPGHSSINNKMTSHVVETQADSFGKACYGLVTTNTMLWEAQEVLYNHDMAALPDSDLRAYIAFFSRGNQARNDYIQRSEQL